MMISNTYKVDEFGVPAWIGAWVDRNQSIFLSETRTYRILMVIVRTIVEATMAKEEAERSRIEFMAWFCGLVADMPAYEGLIWIHAEFGGNIMHDKRVLQLASDRRLAQLLAAYFLLLGDTDDDHAKDYYEMLCDGWEACLQEEQRELLYRGFTGILQAHARDELSALSAERGDLDVDTMLEVYHDWSEGKRRSN